MFVGGLGGGTFGTDWSPAIGAQVGVRITHGLFVIGEIGFQGVVPGEIADRLHKVEEQVWIEHRRPANPFHFNLWMSTSYRFGGVRWVQPGRKITPFLEGGAGFADVEGSINPYRGFSDYTDIIEREVGDLDNLSIDGALLAFGGGLNMKLTRSFSVDAGYRCTPILADSRTHTTSMIYGAAKVGLGR